jgi:PAS domain S-box-containing protein
MLRDREVPSKPSIDAWGRRISDARARLTSEIRAIDDESPLRREGHFFIDELLLAYEELRVAEEELRVQTEELTASRALLDAERLRYRALFESAPVAYLVTNENGVISDANQAAASLLRVPRQRLPGKPLIVFVSPTRRRAFRNQLSAFGANEVESGLHFRMRPRGGALRNVGASVGVVRRRDGAVMELRWLMFDDTKRLRRERRVRNQNEELTHRVAERTADLMEAVAKQHELARAAELARRQAEQANREKSELIAIVSHELRTPLAAIGGYAELLALGVRGPLAEQQQVDVERILQAQSHILRLVDDLVGYSKLETGRLRLDVGDVLLRDAVSALASLVRPQATVKGIEVVVHDSDAEIVARADDERLRQIVLNLLSNAIKFTPRGGHVSLSYRADDTNVHIAINDDGIGIPAEKLDVVFEPYVQLESSGVNEEMGSGLGLAISRDLARAMGGDLIATSSPEEGTVFTVRLPLSRRRPGETPST